MYYQSTFVQLFSKMFCNFLLKLNMANPYNWIKLVKNKISFDLQLSKGDSGACKHNFSGLWKIWQFIQLLNSWSSLIASSISFNSIWGVRYTVTLPEITVLRFLARKQFIVFSKLPVNCISLTKHFLNRINPRVCLQL